MKAAPDIATELGRALDDLAALHMLLSLRSKSTPDLSRENVRNAIHVLNDAVTSLKHVVALVSATGGGPRIE
jgi:hypothetical protein